MRRGEGILVGEGGSRGRNIGREWGLMCAIIGG